MSAGTTPFSMHLADPAEKSQDCQGCGAPLKHTDTTCAYCKRTTPWGARQERLAAMARGNLSNSYQWR